MKLKNLTERFVKDFADCTCPYEGYPCKHILAVLLTFIKDKGKYTQKAKKQEQEIEALEEKIKALSM